MNNPWTLTLAKKTKVLFPKTNDAIKTVEIISKPLRSILSQMLFVYANYLSFEQISPNITGINLILILNDELNSAATCTNTYLNFSMSFLSFILVSG